MLLRCESREPPMSQLGPGRVKTRVLALNTPILEKCILQLDAVSASSVAASDSLRKHFRFGCSAPEFSHGLGHVWTAPAVQEESDYQRSVRVRSCIRPLSAAVWPLALM